MKFDFYAWELSPSAKGILQCFVFVCVFRVFLLEWRGMKPQKLSFTAQEEDLNLRLDRVLVKRFPKFTRQYLQKLLKEEQILINNKKAKPRTLLKLGEKVELTVPEAKALDLKEKDIPLDIIFENKDLLVINKQPGLVVHPGVGDTHAEDSLVNAVLYHCKGNLSGIGGVQRPGIVHRLDKDTSGAILVAKNDQAHSDLALQLKNHEIKKTYVALLVGHLEPKKGSIEAPIGRSSANRKKMAVVPLSHGKKALTNYEVLSYYKTPFSVAPHYTLVKVGLITGRTHQIRVHFTSIGFPLVGDVLYGREKVNVLFKEKFQLERQFLHAQEIDFTLPGQQKRVAFEATLSNDLMNVLTGIETYKV
jgi:23S rRNA pseudouridine1911/1915/1917 synthase